MTIACIISFVVGALTMMCAIGLMSCQKDKKPRNKVRFFVHKTEFGNLALTLLDKVDKTLVEFIDYCAEKYGLNPKDFADMEIGEIREVFLNLED